MISFRLTNETQSDKQSNFIIVDFECFPRHLARRLINLGLFIIQNDPARPESKQKRNETKRNEMKSPKGILHN